MPQEGQDLFGVMDSALKRQQEAAPKKPSERDARSPSIRAAKGEPPAPEQPTTPAPPANEPAAPTTPSSITQRFQRPDPANLAPAPGSLKPGEVLRGTFFSGGLGKRTSGVLQPPEAARVPEPPPPPPAAPPKPAAGPVAPVRPLATGLYRPSARASAVTGVGAPAPAAQAPASAAAPAPAPAPAPAAAPAIRVGSMRVGTGRLEPVAPAKPTQTHGIFVPTQWAVVAVLAVAFGMIVFYWFGYNMAARKFAISPPAAGKRAEKPPEGSRPPVVTPGGLKPYPGLEGGRMPPPPPPPPPAPKYAVKVRAFLMSDPREVAAAGNLANALKSRGSAFADARVLERRSDVNSQCIVVVGRFDRPDDPRADQLRRAVLGLDQRMRGRVEIIQE